MTELAAHAGIHDGWVPVWAPVLKVDGVHRETGLTLAVRVQSGLYGPAFLLRLDAMAVRTQCLKVGFIVGTAGMQWHNVIYLEQVVQLVLARVAPPVLLPCYSEPKCL